jgi:prephenate dehydratase
VANAKIISFVDGMIDGAIVPVQAEIAAARVQATHDIAFIANNLRHDIKIINDLIRHLRLDVNAISAVTTKQRDDIAALTTAVDQQHQVLRALTAGLNELREDVEKLKHERGGQSATSA